MVGRKELSLDDDQRNGDWVWMDSAGYWGPKGFGWVLGSKRFRLLWFGHRMVWLLWFGLNDGLMMKIEMGRKDYNTSRKWKGEAEDYLEVARYQT